jgi:hypothetical protein
VVGGALQWMVLLSQSTMSPARMHSLTGFRPASLISLSHGPSCPHHRHHRRRVRECAVVLVSILQQWRKRKRHLERNEGVKYGSESIHGDVVTTVAH